MLPDLSEMRKKRVKLGINQRELGLHVGVNQSTITKIENGKIRPSYELVYSIFRFLESFEDSSIGLIGDIQVTPVTFVNKSEQLRRALSMMQNSGFKQLPVKDGELVVGSISERSVSRQIVKVKDPTQLLNKPVSEFMEDPFPMVPESTPISWVTSLLQHVQAVLTTRKGRVFGIVTNADLIKVISTG